MDIVCVANMLYAVANMDWFVAATVFPKLLTYIVSVLTLSGLVRLHLDTVASMKHTQHCNFPALPYTGCSDVSKYDYQWQQCCGASSSSLSSSLKFLEWPKQQRHHKDHFIPVNIYLNSPTVEGGIRVKGPHHG